MKKSLFVAGLDFALTNDNLKDMFSQFGTVESAKIVMDKYSGQSRGFGFVDMSSQEDAQQCINNLNNATHNNRQLVVKFKEDKPANSSSSRGGYKQRW
jgi:RNA recognition motif-containing protein